MKDPRSTDFGITHTVPTLSGLTEGCGTIATRVEWDGIELGSTSTPISYRFD